MTLPLRRLKEYNFSGFMNDGKVSYKKAVAILYLLVVHALAIGFIVQQFVIPRIWLSPTPPVTVEDPTVTKEIPTPLPVPSVFHDPSLDNSNVANANIPRPDIALNPGGSLNLIIPVVGVKSEQLVDTFADARSDGRVHDAIDIMAAGGTPVIAAADGKIIRFHDSVPGGITIYQLSSDGKYVYYYAHLQKRADGLIEGQPVTQGTTIGYVGDTGNAGPGNYHLHFSIFMVTDPKRLWEGINIDPYPILKNSPRR